MKLFALITFVLTGCSTVGATTCAPLPVCERIHRQSVLFTGAVADPALPGHTSGQFLARVTVDEAFMGLSPGVKELVLSTSGGWRFEKGAHYLFDVAKGNDGTYYPVVCGSTAAVNSESSVEFLAFLRRWTRNETPTTLSVKLSQKGGSSVPRVSVVAEGQNRTLRDITDAAGIATFRDIAAGTYRIKVPDNHYRSSPTPELNQDVIRGGCRTASIQVLPDTWISGTVVDAAGKPVPALGLELTPYRPVGSKPQFPGLSGSAETNQQGEFRFENIAPGEYLMGVNILGRTLAPVPTTYYPGSREPRGASPLRISLGTTVGGLVFRLPDYGPRRRVKVCVVSESGSPEANIEIGSNPFAAEDGGSFLDLPHLVSNARGCATAIVPAQGRYSVRAIKRGSAAGELRLSDPVVLSPGRPDANLTLILRPNTTEMLRRTN